MDINALHLHIKQKLDKTSSLELPSFEDEEIDFWINDTIYVLLEQIIEGITLQKTGVEEAQKRLDEIKTLIVSGLSLSSNANSYYDNNFCFDLPVDYFRYLGDQVKINTGTSTSKVGTTTVNADTLTIKLKDPFSEHNLHHQTAEPLRMLRGDETSLKGGELIYITDGNYTIDNCYLTYIRKPIEVSKSSNITSDLPVTMHHKLADVTARRMLENIESNRYNTFSAETSIIP